MDSAFGALAGLAKLADGTGLTELHLQGKKEPRTDNLDQNAAVLENSKLPLFET